MSMAVLLQGRSGFCCSFLTLPFAPSLPQVLAVMIMIFSSSSGAVSSGGVAHAEVCSPQTQPCATEPQPVPDSGCWLILFCCCSQAGIGQWFSLGQSKWAANERPWATDSAGATEAPRRARFPFFDPNISETCLGMSLCLLA